MISTSTKRLHSLSIHIVVWLGLMVFPLLWPVGDLRLRFSILVHLWTTILTLLVTFYANYFWLCSMLNRRRLWLFLLLNVALFVAEFVVSHTVFESFNIDKQRRDDLPGAMLSAFVYSSFITYASGVGVAVAVRYAERLFESEMERKRLETEKLTSEISLLKYQIQPHFFFNTLNNIYALVSRSPADAKQAILSLSRMMRYVLYDNSSDRIRLSQEIDFLRNYDNLMKIRVRDTVDTQFEAPADADGLMVPPLLLIPLLENAYKHGVSAPQSFVRSRLTVADGRLRFVVANSLCSPTVDDRSHSGIGLANLRKRLEIIYGADFRFEAAPTPDGRSFVAEIDIPLQA